MCKLKKMKSNIVIGILLLFIMDTFACDCTNDVDSVKTSFLFSDLAIKGKVISMNIIAQNDTILEINESGDTTYNISIDYNARVVYQIIVIDSYKKATPGDTVVISGPAFNTCQPGLNLDEVYFIFADKTEEGNLYTDYCFGNKKYNIQDEKLLIRLQDEKPTHNSGYGKKGR